METTGPETRESDAPFLAATDARAGDQLGEATRNASGPMLTIEPGCSTA